MKDTRTPEEKAKDWLLSHGYVQFQDGTWQCEGYEADAENVLAEYITHEENSRP